MLQSMALIVLDEQILCEFVRSDLDFFGAEIFRRAGFDYQAYNFLSNCFGAYSSVGLFSHFKGMYNDKYITL